MVIQKGKFEAELNEVERLLKKLNFFEERNFYPNKDFDPSVYRSKNYIENWKSLIADNIFMFILSDNSLLNFKYTTSSLSFSFFECPFDCQTYNEFIIENELEDESENKIFEEDYEIYVNQCPLKQNPVMIRYDFDITSYVQGLHPVSHMHIGHKNQVRLGFNKVISPKSFTSFILRQNYPAIWKSLIMDNHPWIDFFKKEKSVLNNVEKTYWNTLDISEFHLA